MGHRIRAAVLAIALIGCTRQPDEVLTLTAASNVPSVVAEAQRVLLARFEQFPASWFASMESNVEGSRITFVFRNGAPDRTTVEYLYATPGVLEAFVTNGSRRGPLFDSGDIRDAALLYVESQYRLRLRLTSEAGTRVSRVTSESVGGRMIVTLDGAVLLDAVITGAFGESLEIGGLVPPRAGEFIAVLRSGALPTAVTAVSTVDGI